MVISVWDMLRLLIFIFLCVCAVDLFLSKKTAQGNVMIFVTVWICVVVGVIGFGLYNLLAA